MPTDESTAGLGSAHAISLTVTAAVLGWCGTWVFAGTPPRYALDDAWIHMAIARHWVEDGVWGVSAVRSAAATSAPLWTALEGLCFALVGPTPALAFALQVPSALALTALVLRWLAPYRPPVRALVTSTVLVVVAALPALVLSGMEHVLHTLLALMILDETARQLDDGPSPARLAGLALLCATATGVRYETLFLLVGTGLVLLRDRRWATLAAGHGGAVVAVAALALWNRATGVGFLPNSVLAKSAFVASDSAVGGLLGAVTRIPAHWGAHNPMLLLMLLVTVAVAMAMAWGREDTRVRLGLVAVPVAAVLHASFAQLGWLFRYEAWLLVLAATVGLRGWAVQPPRSPVAKALVVVPLLLLGFRFQWSTTAARGALDDLRRQHLAMGVALRPFAGRGVALNDIGAVAFLADVEVMDLVGLGDNDVLRARRSGDWNAEMFERIAVEREVAVAAVYDSWFDDGAMLPASWTKVAEWDAGSTTIAGDPVVSFYAVTAPAADLRAALEAHPPPAEVAVRWMD